MSISDIDFESQPEENKHAIEILEWRGRELSKGAKRDSGLGELLTRAETFDTSLQSADPITQRQVVDELVDRGSGIDVDPVIQLRDPWRTRLDATGSRSA